MEEINKTKRDMRRFRHNEVNFDVTYDCRQNMFSRNLDDLHM